jgi:hypothetical protein
MEELLDEPIQVLADFNGNKVLPRVFTWHGRQYVIDGVHLVHQERIGQEAVFFFSVSGKAGAYTLAFHPGTLQWRLKRVFYE